MHSSVNLVFSLVNGKGVVGFAFGEERVFRKSERRRLSFYDQSERVSFSREQNRENPAWSWNWMLKRWEINLCGSGPFIYIGLEWFIDTKGPIS